MPFHVVRVEGRETRPVCSECLGSCDECYNEPHIFNRPEDATYHADYLTRIGNKHQPRPIKSNVDWRKREKERFASGHYTKVPWHDEPWVLKAKECVDHFVHVSKKDQTKISYTSTDLNGERDVKTISRPSRYLANNYGLILTEDQRRELVAKYKKLYDKDNVLLFAYDAKDIERVYRQGPHSCMKSPSVRSKVHPCRVYAGPDLAVAYVERTNYGITARALCWPKKQLYSRIYGDVHLLENLLEEEGYEQGDLEGARFTKLKQGNRYVCPYIDGNYHRVKVGHKYMYITRNGKRYAANQDGFCGQGFRCALCSAEMELYKAGRVVVVNGAQCCEPCWAVALEEGRIFCCGYSRNYYNISEAITMNDGAQWHRAYIRPGSNTGFTCVTCNINYRQGLAHRNTGVGNDGYRRFECRSCAVPQRELAV